MATLLTVLLSYLQFSPSPKFPLFPLSSHTCTDIFLTYQNFSKGLPTKSIFAQFYNAERPTLVTHDRIIYRFISKQFWKVLKWLRENGFKLQMGRKFTSRIWFLDFLTKPIKTFGNEFLNAWLWPLMWSKVMGKNCGLDIQEPINIWVWLDLVVVL